MALSKSRYSEDFRQLPEDLQDKFIDLLQKSVKSDGSKAVVKAILKLLLDAKVAYKIRINCRFVLCHPLNRGGLGINVEDVHLILSEIWAAGWDSDEIRAICTEISEESKGGIVEFNMQMVEDAIGKLAPVEPALARFASISGGHLNQGFRLIANMCKHDCEEMTTNGCLDLSKIKQRYPDWADAVTEGCEWTVIPAWLVKDFPELLVVIEKSQNTGSKIKRGHHDFEIFRSMVASWAKHKDKDKPWEAVKQDLLASTSKPEQAKWLHNMFKFFLKFGGGDDSPFIKGDEKVCKTFGVSAKVICSGDDWEHVIADIRGAEQFVAERHLMICIRMICDDKFSSNDIRSLLKQHGKSLLTVRDIADTLKEATDNYMSTYLLFGVHAFTTICMQYFVILACCRVVLFTSACVA